MVATNTIEVTGMQNELSKLENRKTELNQQFQDAIEAKNAALCMSIGNDLRQVENEIEVLEKRYAKLTGEAIPNQKGIAAKNLKNLVSETLDANLDAIYQAVRDIWSLQTDRKLSKIEIVFDAENPQPKPLINLVGGFRNVEAGTTASGNERKQREVTRWIVPGEDDPVGRKKLILLYGEKYGQTVMFDQMTPKAREELSDKIAAGENFAKA